MPSYGFRGQIGFGEEATYGTPATIAKFMELKSESLKRAIAEYVSPGLRVTPNQLKTQRYQTKEDIGGDVVMDAYLAGQGMLWKHALGAVASVQQGAGPAYLHTFTCTDDLPIGLTAEIERDARAFKYSGLKIASLRIRQGEDGALELTWGFKGKSEALAASPTVATYATSNKLFGVGLTVLLTIGGVTYQPSNFEVNLANALDDKRYGFNKNRYALPFIGREVTGTVSTDFDDQAVYDMFTGGVSAALVMKYTGAIIATTYSEELTITLPVVVFNGETPNIKGKGDIPLVLPFRALADGANKPIQVTLQNSETTVV
jgi:hypothetical protein